MAGAAGVTVTVAPTTGGGGGGGGLELPPPPQLPAPEMVADLAAMLDAPVLVVTTPGLGTLNHTALTLEALAPRRLVAAGVVIGAVIALGSQKWNGNCALLVSVPSRTRISAGR